MKRLTDVAYWDRNWNERERPRRLVLYRDFDYETARLLGARIHSLRERDPSRPPRVLELGGGASRVLPYLASKFNCEAYASDFSWRGCELLRANCALQRVGAKVVCEDLFQSSLPDESFDLVYSSGLIEHFDDTRAAVEQHLRVLKPAGELLLIVPNLEGIQSHIWRRYAPSLWEKHRVFGPGELARMLDHLRLEKVRSGYLGSFFLHIGHGPDWEALVRRPAWAQLALSLLVRLGSGLVSLAFRLLPWRPHSRALSPGFFALGTKPSSSI